jgi:hypothetical protein
MLLFILAFYLLHILSIVSYNILTNFLEQNPS